MPVWSSSDNLLRRQTADNVFLVDLKGPGDLENLGQGHQNFVISSRFPNDVSLSVPVCSKSDYYFRR